MKKLLVILVFFGLAAWTGYTAFSRENDKGNKRASQPAAIIAAEVAPHDFADRIEAIGTAFSNESAELAATVTGTVQQIAFEEGTQVKAGTVIVTLRDDEQQATLSEASRSYERYSSLVKNNAAAVAQKEEERARMQVAKAQLRDRQIVAPFDGVLGLRRVSLGDVVSAGTLITTIDDIDPIKLEFTVPEAFIPVLKVGMPVEALTQAYPSRVFKGNVTVLDTRVDPVARAIIVKAVIPNPEGELRAGMLMTVSLIKNQRQALAIPEEGLNPIGQEQQVMVVDAENKVKTRKVTIGERHAGYVEIRAGLQQGEKIVLEGGSSLREGQPVKITSTRTIGQSIDAGIEYANPRKKQALEALGKQQ